MEREAAVFSDEGAQETYPQHTFQSRLSRPNSLPGFHIGSQLNPHSPFGTLCHSKGQFSNDVYHPRGRQSEFIIGDPMLVSHSYHNQLSHHASPNFYSPQFVWESRHNSSPLFRHPSYSEQKSCVDGGKLADYSPVSMKLSPMFAYHSSHSLDEQKNAAHSRGGSNAHLFSPSSNFPHFPNKMETDKSSYCGKNHFLHDIKQTGLLASPVALNFLETAHTQSPHKQSDLVSGFFENVSSSEGNDSIFRSNGKEQRQREAAQSMHGVARSRDEGMFVGYDSKTDSSEKRERSHRSSDELNKSRKSVICISSKDEVKSLHGDSLLQEGLFAKKDQQLKNSSPLNGKKDLTENSCLHVNEPLTYTKQSPSKRRRLEVEMHHSAPNLFESLFNLGDSGSSSKDFLTPHEPPGGRSRNSFENRRPTDKGGFEKVERQGFISNQVERLVEDCQATLPVRHCNAPMPDDGNAKQKCHILEDGSKFRHRDRETSARSENMLDSFDKTVRVVDASSELPREGKASSKMLEYSGADFRVSSKMCESSPFGNKVGEIDSVIVRSDAANNDIMTDDVKSHDNTGLKTDYQKDVINELNDNRNEVEIISANAGREKRSFIDGDKGECLIASEITHAGCNGVTVGKQSIFGDANASTGVSGDGTAETVRFPADESFPSEQFVDVDAVVKRVLSREERAIQYAMEKFKEMEEKRNRRTGKRKPKSITHDVTHDQKDVVASNGQDLDAKKPMTEAKAELRRRSKKQKGKRASGNGRSNPMNCGNVTGGEKFEKGGRKNGVFQHSSLGCETYACSGESMGCNETAQNNDSRKEHRASKKLYDDVSIHAPDRDKDLSRVKQDMQQKSYLLVPSYKGFKDFSPVVLEGRTRRHSTPSDTERVGKKKFPILVVETVGEKRNEILVQENEDLNAKVAKESLLAEKVFENEESIDGKSNSTIKQLSCNRMTGETVLHKAARLGYDDVVDVKIKEGANVNARDNAGWTPLHEACVRGKTNVVRVLLRYGADPNCRSESGIRPLHDAIDSNNIDIIRLLLSYGADVSLNTYSGLKSIQIARSQHVKKFLKGYIGDIKEPGLLENLSDYIQERWQFRGTSSVLDGDADDAKEIFQNLPANSDLQIEFLASSREPLPTYNLPVYENETVIGFQNYYVLEDVLSWLSVSRHSFLKKHKVELRILSLEEISSYLRQSQVTAPPNPPASSEQGEDSLIELVHIGHFAARKMFDLKAYQV